MGAHSDNTACDVLVAGSGAAGLPPRSPRAPGLDVLMVEKEPLFGGTTAFSAGVIWIPANSLQGRRPRRHAGGGTHLPAPRRRQPPRSCQGRGLFDEAAMLALFEREALVPYSSTDLGRLPPRRARRLPGRALPAARAVRRPKLGAGFRSFGPRSDHDAVRRHDAGTRRHPHVFRMTRSAARRSMSAVLLPDTPQVCAGRAARAWPTATR